MRELEFSKSLSGLNKSRHSRDLAYLAEMMLHSLKMKAKPLPNSSAGILSRSLAFKILVNQGYLPSSEKKFEEFLTVMIKAKRIQIDENPQKIIIL